MTNNQAERFAQQAPLPPGQPPEKRAAQSAEETRRRSRARRRVDEVFGDVLPATTDREPGEGGGFSADHYRRDRPPHHVG